MQLEKDEIQMLKEGKNKTWIIKEMQTEMKKKFYWMIILYNALVRIQETTFLIHHR